MFGSLKPWDTVMSGALCAAMCCFSQSASRDAAAARPPERRFAEDLEGKVVDPLAMSSGRAVVLLFVRTDCPISNRYAPLIQKLNEKFNGKANFWLVYSDPAETAAQIRRARATITPEAAVFRGDGKLVYHGRIDNWYEDFGRSRAAATTHELEDGIVAALNGKAMMPDHMNAVGCYISDLR